MFRFFEEVFIRLLSLSFGKSLASDGIKFISLSNQPCQSRSKFGIISNEPLYYPFTVSVNKCVGSCNNFDDSYVRLCVPNDFKNMSLKLLKIG